MNGKPETFASKMQAFGLAAAVVALFVPIIFGALLPCQEADVSEFKTSRCPCPTGDTAQGQACPVKGDDTIAPAPEKVFQPAGAPAVHQDDTNMTKELINGFYSPMAPGGMGE